MLKEAIETIVKLGRESIAAKLVEVPQDPTIVLVDHNGTLSERKLPPRPRSHEVYDLEDLIAAAHRNIVKSPSVFHCESEVVMLLSDEDRRERITMPLGYADTFLVLQELVKHPRLFQPKELAQLLKCELAGTNFPDEVIRGLKRLKWTSRSELRQSFDHGRESIGKDVEAELQSDVELPEFTEIETPVYSNPGEDRVHEIRVLIEPMAHLQKIAFQPVPGELEEAIKQAQRDIRKRLESGLPTGTPIYHGKP